MKVQDWQFNMEILNFARDNLPLVDECMNANEPATKLTEWFQAMNDLACFLKYIVTGKSDVPRWFSMDLQRLKEEFQSHKFPGPSRNHARNQYTNAIRKAKRAYTRESASKNKGGAWKVLNPCKSINWLNTFKKSSPIDEKQLANKFATHFRHKIDSLKTRPYSSDILSKLKDF